MLFKDVIGQEEAKQRLIAEVKEGRIPHAQLICGPEGTGKLPLAIAYARYICCENRGEQDACGICPTCVKFNKLIHPDLHFVFPVIKKKAGKDTVCDDFIADWRNFVLQNPYFNLNHWLKEMGAENQQAQIFVKESDEIVRKLSLKSSQGGYKIMRQWSDAVASMGRERQKNFLAYCQRMIRENFIYNFHQRDLVYMNPEEQNFSTRFAPFVNERNVMGIMDELSEAQLHIGQNVNPKMVFFDFSLKMIVLLKN